MHGAGMRRATPRRAVRRRLPVGAVVVVLRSGGRRQVELMISGRPPIALVVRLTQMPAMLQRSGRLRLTKRRGILGRRPSRLRLGALRHELDNFSAVGFFGFDLGFVRGRLTRLSRLVLW